MNVLIALVIIVIALAAGISLIGFTASLLWYALIGLIIGALARLIVKGTGGMGILATILCGVGGAIGGGVIGEELLELGGIGQFILSVVLAAVLILLFGRGGGRDELVA